MSELRDEEEVAASVEPRLECTSEPEAAVAEKPSAIMSILLSSSMSVDVPYDSEDGLWVRSHSRRKIEVFMNEACFFFSFLLQASFFFRMEDSSEENRN